MAEAAPLVPAQLPLLRELGDLKRLRSAGAAGSAAERLFARAWAALVRGEPAAAVARRTAAAALAAARLGDLDAARLRVVGLDGAAATAALERSFDEVAGVVDPAFAADLRAALADGAPDAGPTPPFVDALARQPRAGVTCPGRPRVMLLPAESHADHCLTVAVYGMVAAPACGADPTAAFLAGLAHHLHNAAMPDSGFSGEVLLGDRLDPVIARARDMALAELDPPLADTVRAALAPIGGDATPEARAFHAADVVDRVLEIEQHLARARVTMADVLDTYSLVHDGPVKPFHDRVLAGIGLG
jgi:5'-deoxynucleotidase YfbR-like HD superfamily hydrolase